MSSSSSSDVENTIADTFDDDDDHSVIQALLDAIIADQAATMRGGCVGRVRNYNKIERGPCSWFTDYVAPHPRYPRNVRSIFCISLSLYNRLHNELVSNYAVFRQKTDAAGKQGHTNHQKILSPLPHLATGVSFNQIDGMARMSVESQRNYFRSFLLAMKQN